MTCVLYSRVSTLVICYYFMDYEFKSKNGVVNTRFRIRYNLLLIIINDFKQISKDHAGNNMYVEI